jgi:hypothetical protein
VSLLSSVIVQVRLGRSDRRSAAWRLAGGLSPRRDNILQLVSIVGFSPTSEIDGGGAQHIGGGSPHSSG